MRYQTGSCCPCQCQQVSNLLPAPSQVMGWATPGKEEKQPAHGQGLATRNNLSLSPNPDSHKFEIPENMAGPSQATTIPHREMGFTIVLTVIPDLASKGPSPLQKPQDSEMPGPQSFLFLAPTHPSSETSGPGIRNIGHHSAPCGGGFSLWNY